MTLQWLVWCRPIVISTYFLLFPLQVHTPLQRMSLSSLSITSHCSNICSLSKEITWSLSDRTSWIDYILITNLIYWLLFIHKILFSSTCFEPQVLIFRRTQLYTCSIWYCHSLWEFLVVCRYTAWVRTQAVYRQATKNSHREWQSICCLYTTVSSWRWALEARNM